MARKLTVQHPKSARASTRVKRPASSSGWGIVLIYLFFYGIVFLMKKLANNGSEETNE